MMNLTDDRLDELVKGAPPSEDEAALVAVVQALKAAPPKASPELRERVNETLARRPARARLSGLSGLSGLSRPTWPSLRRPLLVLAPVAAAALVAVVVVGNVVTETTLDEGGALQSAEAPRSAADQGAQGDQAAPQMEAAPGGAEALPGPDTTRPQDYDAEMSVEVDSVEELSRGTVQVMRLARDLGGYLASADYDASREGGHARLVVAVPVERVDEALADFGELGTITSQRVSIRDLGEQIDDLAAAVTRARLEVSRLERALAADPESEILRIQLDEARRQLEQLLAQRDDVEETAALADVTLTLYVQQEPEAAPGSAEKALDEAGEDLAAVWSAVLYLTLVLAPFLVVIWLLAFLWRRARAERDRDLLERH